jgi:ubiquinone/menaquinone biosynthesis C-methylase UbiE
MTNPGARIADLGCGTGTSALMQANELGLELSAIDLSEDNIKRAESRLSSHHGPARWMQLISRLIRIILPVQVLRS